MLRTDDAARLAVLSSRAHSLFREDLSDHARIESLYHLLGSDEEKGADECEALDRDFTTRVTLDPRKGLAAAMQELLDEGVLDDAASAVALVCVAEYRNQRGETADLRRLVKTRCGGRRRVVASRP